MNDPRSSCRSWCWSSTRTREPFGTHPLVTRRRGYLADGAVRSVNHQGIGILAPARVARAQTGQQLRFLAVAAELDQAALVAVNDEARCAASHHHAGMQDNAGVPIVENDVGPVIGFSSLALPSQIGLNTIRQAEKQKRLIDKVRPQIEPDAIARPGTLSPPIADFGAKPVEMRLEMGDAPDLARLYRLSDSLKIAVPTTVVKHRQQSTSRFSHTDQFAGLDQIKSKGLVHHHRLARLHRGPSQRRMTGIGTGDHDQVQALCGDEREGIVKDDHVGHAGADLVMIAR